MNILLDTAIFGNSDQEKTFIETAESMTHRVVLTELTKTFTIDDFMAHYALDSRSFVYGPIPFVRSQATKEFLGNYLINDQRRYFFESLLHRINDRNKHCFLNHDAKRLHGLLDNIDYHDMVVEFLSETDANKIFIKENNPFKIVQNKVVNVNEIFDVLKEYKELIHGAYLIPVKEIQHEARAIVYNKKIVDASYYIIDDEIKYEPFGNTSKLQSILNESRLIDSAATVNRIPLVVDFVYSEGSWKILEVNCISSSGWYACSIEKILNVIEDSLRI